ncbi:MAG: chemotaxis-specific protein-glutamate methyltransferase CheB [Desulfovibrionaceae bacterium]
MAEAVKVLIIDPSTPFKRALDALLSRDDDMKVLGRLIACERATDFIMQTPPDVVILDISLPDALDFIRWIQRFNVDYPAVPEIGIILVASRSHRLADVTIQALEAGAFDFVTRPDAVDINDVAMAVHRQLLVKVRSFSSKRIFSSLAASAPRKSAPAPTTCAIPRPPADASKIRAVVIGVSTGGPKALSLLLPALCAQTSLPIFIVQHMPANFTESLAQSLNAKCRHSVVEAKDMTSVTPETVYIAPGGRHMRLARNASRAPMVSLSDDPPVDGCRPSVNMLFDSAADVYAGNVVAVVLTGMGSDGTRGLAALKRVGAYVLAQDKASSVVWGMPGSAVASGHVDKVAALDDIACEVANVMRGL